MAGLFLSFSGRGAYLRTAGVPRRPPVPPSAVFNTSKVHNCWSESLRCSVWCVKDFFQQGEGGRNATPLVSVCSQRLVVTQRQSGCLNSALVSLYRGLFVRGNRLGCRVALANHRVHLISKGSQCDSDLTSREAHPQAFCVPRCPCPPQQQWTAGTWHQH